MHVHIQTLTAVHSRAHKHYYISHTRFLAPKLLSNNSRSCAASCVYFVMLCLCKDRTGRDKGSPVGVFTANTVEENSFRRRWGRGLMAGAKQPDPSCCEKSPQSQEGDTQILIWTARECNFGERKNMWILNNLFSRWGIKQTTYIVLISEL